MFDFIAKSAPVQMYIKKLCVAVKQIDEKKTIKEQHVQTWEQKQEREQRGLLDNKSGLSKPWFC